MRSAGGPLPTTLFRRSGQTRTAARRLSESPGEAHRELLHLLDGRVSLPVDPEALDVDLPRLRRVGA